MQRRFTDLTLQNLKAGDVRREIPIPGAQGLYCVIQPSGKKSFAVRYRFNGKTRKLTLSGPAASGQAQEARLQDAIEICRAMPS